MVWSYKKQPKIDGNYWEVTTWILEELNMEELQDVRAKMVYAINEISSQPNSYMVECMVIAQRAMLRIVEDKIEELNSK